MPKPQETIDKQIAKATAQIARNEAKAEENIQNLRAKVDPRCRAEIDAREEKRASDKAEREQYYLIRKQAKDAAKSANENQ